MSAHLETGYERLDAAAAAMVDRACDAFEEAWQTGNRPPIEALCQSVAGPAQDVLLRELIAFEIAARQRAGDAAVAGEYLDRFPQVDPAWLERALAVVPADLRTQIAGTSSPSRPLTVGSGEAQGGRRLGKFELRRELGRGGYGVVHLAYEPLLEREVALKVPHEHVLADPELRSRFQREARAAAGLNHPNIVPVHEAGEIDAVSYIALAYCPGITLHDWLRRRVDSIPGPAIAEFVAILAGAIHHAHEQGIIHRDLKPANVLLESGRVASSAGADGDNVAAPVAPHESLLTYQPKITDFGLAKDLDAQGEQTRTGTLAGTPCYMAPEQTGASVWRVGPATDVYALGAILYELLTGRAPFQGETVLDTLHQVRHDDPVPPRRLRPGLPRDLEVICLKCLEKDPARRYASARMLEDDLRRYLGGHSIHARPSGPLTQVAKWAVRRPAAAALVGVSLLALLLLIGSDLYIRQKNRETEAALKGETRAKNSLTSTLKRERQSLYFDRIRLAQAALRVNNVRQAERYLEAYLPQRGEPDLRGWEWHYLMRQCHAEQFTFLRHANVVRDVALSPDRRQAASVSLDGTGMVWVAATGQVLWSFPVPTTGGPRHQHALAYGPRGDCLAYGDHTRNLVTLFDASDGHVLRTLEGCQPTFSPEGDRLAIVDSPPIQVRVYDTASGEQLHSFPVPTANSIAVALAAEEIWLAAALSDQTIRVWNPQTQVELNLERPTADRQGYLTLAFSHSGRHLASGASDGTLKLWELPSGRELFSVRAHVGLVECLAFAPDGQRLASADTLGYLKLWNLQGQEVQALPGHGYVVRRIAFDGDGRLLASAGLDKRVKIWDTARDPQMVACRGHTNFVLTLAFSPDSRQLVSSSLDATLKVWDPATGRIVATVPDQSGHSRTLSWTADRSRLVACDKFGGVTEWDAASLNTLHTLPERGNRRRTSALTADGRYVAFSGDDKQTITLRDVATGRLVCSWQTSHAVALLAFSPDGQRLAVAGEDFSIEVWESATGRRLAAMRGHSDKINGLVFSPDGRTLAAGGEEDLIRLWDAATGRQRLAIQNRWGRKTLYAIAFSPDGSRLVTGGFDAAVVLWDTETGQEVLELPTDRMGVTGLAFSPDGWRLAATINDSSLAIWDATVWTQPTP